MPNPPRYEYAGHGTTIYMTGPQADGYYCHTITSRAGPGQDAGDLDIIAYVPDNGPEGPNGNEIANVLGAAFDLRDATEKLWEFASKLVAKHGENGDGTLTDAEHMEWQDAGGAANAALAKADGTSLVATPDIG